jgi:hypothetical protein
VFARPAVIIVPESGLGHYRRNSGAWTIPILTRLFEAMTVGEATRPPGCDNVTRAEGGTRSTMARIDSRAVTPHGNDVSHSIVFPGSKPLAKT